MWKITFCWPYWPLNYFYHKPLNSSRQDTPFEHLYDYILIFFWPKRWQNSKILSLMSFFYLMEIKKVRIFCHFSGGRGALVKTYLWPPWKELEKRSQHVGLIFKKLYNAEKIDCFILEPPMYYIFAARYISCEKT